MYMHIYYIYMYPRYSVNMWLNIANNPPSKRDKYIFTPYKCIHMDILLVTSMWRGLWTFLPLLSSFWCHFLFSLYLPNCTYLWSSTYVSLISYSKLYYFPEAPILILSTSLRAASLVAISLESMKDAVIYTILWAIVILSTD